jgi:hypothetical protein
VPHAEKSRRLIVLLELLDDDDDDDDDDDELLVGLLMELFDSDERLPGRSGDRRNARSMRGEPVG